MNVFVPLFLVQSLMPAQQAPVLEIPEAGLDDFAAYEGFTTRFFRDSHRNAFQIYLDTRSGRVVHVWADAANASAAFTIRDASGEPAPLTWGDSGAEPSADGPRRVMRHRLSSDRDALEIGWFVLGTMRQERDFQYLAWHRRAYGDGRFVLAELSSLVRNVERLPDGERERHLSLLDARDLDNLRARLHPRMTLTEHDGEWVVLVAYSSIDGRHHMTVELRGDANTSTARLEGGVVSLRARVRGGGMQFDVTATTDERPLTPLDRSEIFNDAFEAFHARHRVVADSLRRALSPAEYARHPSAMSFRRLDRAVRGLGLLSYEEKLMAALPNYATYFGRDMMMSALMLEPVVSADLQEHVIGNVLRKLSPDGDVSHEEALGGQAVRENAAEYNRLIDAWDDARDRDPAVAAESLARARQQLTNLQSTRENYHMIDDDFQFPVLVDRYLARRDVPDATKRRFLDEAGPNGVRRLDALVRNLALVVDRARPYAEQPTTANLVGFLHRDDDGWFPGSWRDSRVGYGMGRFAMDVNVVWVPKAMEATERILRRIETLGLSAADAASRASIDVTTLQTYLRDPEALRGATATWRGARRHFEVTLEPDVIRERTEKLLVSLPGEERDYWARLLRERRAATEPMSFLVLALDDDGRPIAGVNTDPATDLFLEDYTEQILRGSIDPTVVTSMLDVFVRPYPAGLFVDGLGPLVVNDAYASAEVQERFRGDLYHSPRVVWGREVNLLLLGLARQVDAAYDSSGRLRDDSEAVRSYVDALRRALETTRRAVEASGMRHNELWSYRIEGGMLRPVRYGTSSDIQLWNLTDLAVTFVLDRLPPR